jgi:hypothetical protein
MRKEIRGTMIDVKERKLRRIRMTGSILIALALSFPPWAWSADGWGWDVNYTGSGPIGIVYGTWFHPPAVHLSPEERQQTNEPRDDGSPAAISVSYPLLTFELVTILLVTGTAYRRETYKLYPMILD